MPPRVRARELWRYRPAVARGGPGRRDPRRRARPGARRPGRRSPTARCAARATPTASRPPPGASTSTTRARPSAARASRRPCRASRARCTVEGAVQVRDVAVPARGHRPHDQDDRARARSRWPSRRRTSTTSPEEDLAFAFADVVREEIARAVRGRRGHRAARRAVDGGAPGAARRHGLETLQRALDGVQGTRDAAHLLRLSAVRARPPDRLPVPDRAGLLAGRPDLDRDRAVGPRRLGALRARRTRP